MTDRERRIRDLAHQIWEEAGRPTGDDARHWSEAERRYDAEQGAGSEPKARAAKSDKVSKPDAAKSAKAKDTKPAKPKAVSKTAEAPKPKAKTERASAKAGTAKSKGSGKAKS